MRQDRCSRTSRCIGVRSGKLVANIHAVEVRPLFDDLAVLQSQQHQQRKAKLLPGRRDSLMQSAVNALEDEIGGDLVAFGDQFDNGHGPVVEGVEILLLRRHEPFDPVMRRVHLMVELEVGVAILREKVEFPAVDRVVECLDDGLVCFGGHNLSFQNE
ncbi:hypothetical protein APA386B_2P13 (plasmid) [Acetobacter pasteurianus 386B]|nr:hypothetical protein APA386B_2P13 [Acetobacter pasteurianus 386B]